MGTDSSTPPLPPLPAPLIPHIHLLCMHKTASDAFTQALISQGLSSSSSSSSSSTSSTSSTSDLHHTIHNTYLSDLPATLQFDLIVSPANSYGILDGGFDDAISRALSPRDSYGALTRAAQQALYRRHAGYLPPGGCCLVRIPESFRGGRLRYHDGGGGWGCRYLALCPTMRVPSPCGWDREVVYECVWSLLCAIDLHNNNNNNGVADLEDGGGEGGEGRRDGDGDDDDDDDDNASSSKKKKKKKIESILMTPLGTGAGGISDEKWAKQAVLAIKHWLDAKQNPEKWSKMNWEDARDVDKELRVTHKV